MEWSGKTALINTGASGNGFGIVRAFADAAAVAGNLIGLEDLT
jgi:NAD(P)-dependent dehydrogenase (short-subunit alcohol dehydrogenase family)